MKKPAGWRARIHPDDLAACDAAIVAHFRRKAGRLESEYRYRAKDRSRHWARQRGSRRTRLLRRILERPVIAPYIESEHVPGAQVQSDDDWLACMREAGTTIYHPSCSAMMDTGADAVMDSQMRVKGLDGLRVVDASVMPALVSGNTNAAVIAIAGKAADLIAAGRR